MYLDVIDEKGPFPKTLSGGFNQLAPLGPNLVEHYWQWGAVDEYWWGTYLVDLLKQHAKNKTLTYRNFKIWFESIYWELAKYLEYLQVYPLEFERVLFWLSQNPDKINFDTLKRLLRSMRLVLMINGVGTSKVRYMYSNADIMADQEWCLPWIYKGFRLFNTLQYKITREQSLTIKPYMNDLMKEMYGGYYRHASPGLESNQGAHSSFVLAKIRALIVAATNLEIKIPYQPA